MKFKELHRNFFLVLILIFIWAARINADELEGFEFSDMSCSEIFYTLSMYSGKEIFADDTVDGDFDFCFAGGSFESAFENFLKANRLYVQKNEQKWIVSRFCIEPSEDGLFFLDASDVDAAVLLEKISSYFKTEIAYRILPDNRISIHTTGADVFDLCESVCRRLGKNYECSQMISRENENLKRILIECKEENKVIDFSENFAGICSVEFSDEKFACDLLDAKTETVLDKIFTLAGREYFFAFDGGGIINRSQFADKTFEETLELVCKNNSLSYTLCDGIYYVYKNENAYRIEDADKSWHKVAVENCDVAKIISDVKERFSLQRIISLENESGFILFCNKKVLSEVEEFVKLMDKEKNVFIVNLKYIRTDELLAKLPPDVAASNIVSGTSDNVFFFTGTENQYNKLMSLLETVDVPVKRLRYDLLVIQYQGENESTWNINFSVDRLKIDDRNSASAVLGSVLNLNLDVVTAFGFKFAGKLQTAINENRANVFADTVLYGISGGTISFRNFNTYRYRDNNLDPDTGKPVYTGITREIDSGLKIDITGWVGGDGMITSKVTASVSRQGTDLSSLTGNPPPSSEKVITTEVRGPSGEPIVLSGLVQNEETFIQERTPVVSRIPLIGSLFRNENKTSQKTEMVIYLLPHWEKDEVTSAGKRKSKENKNKWAERILKTYAGELYED